MRSIESIIYNETVNDIINRTGIITEMAIPVKLYKKRLDGLRFQLVENWCLCKWCQLYENENINFAHWITELKACIDNLKLVNIKNNISKKNILNRMVIDDYDYNDINMISRIIRSKFNIENINDNNQKNIICNEFANNINTLIDVISDDDIDSDDYIKYTFEN